MSSPGLPQQPAPDDPQQPLFGQPAVDPNMVKLQQVLAQQMMQGGQPQGPISSPLQVLHQGLSPLLGALMQKHAAKQQAAMEQAAMPEIQKAMSSADPLSALAGSQNPLVRQMVFQSMPEFMKQQMMTQGEIHKRQVLDPLDIQKAIGIAQGTEPIEVKKASDIAAATVPLEIKKAVGIAQGTLPIDLLKVRAGQAATYAGQAETKRHNLAMEGAGSGGGGASPIISTKADFDKLPSGTVYREPDGNTYRKP